MGLWLKYAPSSIEEALPVYYDTGFHPILVHAPVHPPDHVCTCGLTHEVNDHGTSACGKHPVASSWQKPASLETLRNHLARLKFKPNVGIVLGEQQNGEYIIAIDVDDEERFQVLLSELGPLPDTVRGDSGRGSRLLFEWPKELPTGKLKNVSGLTPHRTGDSEKRGGVDVKVRGGQVVVAPSLHVSGKTYSWTHLGAIELLPMSWALEIATTPEVPKFVEGFTPQSIREDTKTRRRAEAYLEKAVMDDARIIAGCGEGFRNATLYKRAVAMFALCGGMHLGDRWGYVHDQLRAAALHCGLKAHEVDRTLSSAESYVRAKGEIRTPVVLADPPKTPAPAPPPPPPDGTPPATPPMGPSGDPRPTIRISVEIHENSTAAIKALATDGTLYQRDGQLVHVIGPASNEKDADRLPKTLKTAQSLVGTPQIRSTALPTLRERLTRVVRFEKWTEKNGWSRAVPTDHIVAAVLGRGEYPSIRPLAGISETPFLRQDGTLIQVAGYDPESRFLYMPNMAFPTVPENPTQTDAQNAYQELVDLFVDFRYEKPEQVAVPIAAILTLLARPAIGGATPCFAFDASTRGSGKTLHTDVIAAIASGRLMPRMTYPLKEEEVEKVLGAYAMRGAPFFSFDNVNRPFGGGPIDKVLTARDTVDLRILGKTEIPSLTWRSVMFCNGNNLDFFADTARRILRARIEPLTEHPESRTNFKHRLPREGLENRGRYIELALTILRAFIVAGSPSQGCPRWGSFEEWSEIIPHAIVWAGGHDPMRCRPASDAEVDSQSAALAAFLTEVFRLFENKEWRAAQLIDLLFHATPQSVAGAPSAPTGLEILKEAVGNLCNPKSGHQPDAQMLGKRLAAAKGRVLHDLRLVERPGQAGTKWWAVERVPAA